MRQVGLEGKEMLSSMHYPHWMIVGGADLVVIGFVGLALRRNEEEEQDDGEPSEKPN